MSEDRRFAVFWMTHKEPTKAADHILDLESQLAATQQRLAECERDIERHNDIGTQLAESCAEEMAGRVAAEADVGRLDWLDTNLSRGYGWSVSVAPLGNIGTIFPVARGTTTIRAAIDTAMGRG